MLRIFLDELRKMGALDDGVPPGRMSDNEPHPVGEADVSSEPQEHGTPSGAPSESIFGKTPEATQPEPTKEAPIGPAGSLGTLGVRQTLEERLGSTDGRKDIRRVFSYLRRRDEDTVQLRRAFTRALLRAHRNTQGPSPTPRRALRDLLYSREPYAETSRT